MSDTHKALTYRELQAALKAYGKACTVKLNSKREVLEAEYTRLLDTGASHEEPKTKRASSKKADETREYTYRELQAQLKTYGIRCEVKRNSKYEVLLNELQRLVMLDAEQAAHTEEQTTETRKQQSWASKARERGYSETEAEAMERIMSQGNAKQKAAVVARLS